MRWTPGGTSGDIEDRRDEGGGGGFSPMGFGGGRGIGLGGLLLLGVLSLLFKTNLLPLAACSAAEAPRLRPRDRPTRSRRRQEEPTVKFVSFVLDDAQDTWTKIFAEQGAQYPHAKLVLFRDVIRSACGMAESASGPFYCPGDQKVYVDLSFFDELRTNFGAPGEFAQAYVLAHELGHHVQNVIGIERKVRAAQQRNPRLQNQFSVLLELQADCLAGVWGHSTAQRNLLEPGEAEQGLRAAAAIGDDRLQRMAGRSVSPESFTHGTSRAARVLAEARPGARHHRRLRYLQQSAVSRAVMACVYAGRESHCVTSPSCCSAGPSQLAQPTACRSTVPSPCTSRA